MSEQIFYCAGRTEALAHGVEYLRREGCIFTAEPDRSVTHLLLDIPHRDPSLLPGLLTKLSQDVIIVGGNLRDPALQGYETTDLLQDPHYLAENANITAHCAVKLALAQLPVTLYRCPVLIIGWGRIGKCLAQLLRQMGCQVTVSARKEADRAMLAALGYNTIALSPTVPVSGNYRVIFNTVPAPVLSAQQLQIYPASCLKLELASLPGLAGDDIIDARGLPSRCAPESSGELIARSILRLCRETSTRCIL